MRKYFTNLNLSSALFGQCAQRGAHPGEHRSSGMWGTTRAAQRGPPELLSGERVPGSTALAGCGGPPELLSGECVLGSMGLYWCFSGSLGVSWSCVCPGEQSFSSVGENAHYGA
jgi:hypothetical protein